MHLSRHLLPTSVPSFCIVSFQESYSLAVYILSTPMCVVVCLSDGLYLNLACQVRRWYVQQTQTNISSFCIFLVFPKTVYFKLCFGHTKKRKLKKKQRETKKKKNTLEITVLLFILINETVPPSGFFLDS